MIQMKKATIVFSLKKFMNEIISIYTHGGLEIFKLILYINSYAYLVVQRHLYNFFTEPLK